MPNAFTIPTTSLTGSMKRADLAAAISRRSTAANSRARAQGRNLLPIGVLTGKDSRTFSAPVIGAERGRAATDNNQRMRKTSI